MMSLLWAIVIGFIVGLIARALTPGAGPKGFILTTILGILGAVLATFIGRGLGFYAEGSAAGFIASVIGAVILLLIYGMFTRRRSRL